MTTPAMTKDAFKSELYRLLAAYITKFGYWWPIDTVYEVLRDLRDNGVRKEAKP